MDAFSFFWHDYETFGRDPRRDRPAQFAGVRTDARLNEIGEPVMLYCQPATDCLPDPESCLLTGITPQHCQAHGVREAEFARQVHAALAAPGTVGVGYNTIRFDDEVTRHLFWRNLIDPYGREWQNGCGRWDLLDTVRCAWALRPEGLQWPRHDDGRVSFKLEHLSAANGLLHAAAHDALSDVRATIALARLLRDTQPRLFEFCLKLRSKQAVWQEIGPLGAGRRPFLHVSGMYPADRGCLAVVWPLAPHPTNKNELVVWDLAHDPTELLDLGLERMRQRLYTRSAELPEGMQRLPVKTIHVNRSPVVIGNLKTLSPALATRWGHDLDQVQLHAQAAASAADALQSLPWDAVLTRPAGEPPDVDHDLYGGFIGQTDRRTLERLQGLSPQALAARQPAFEDGRLDELLFRWRARNWPDTLDAEAQQRWTAHCRRRLHEGEGGGITLAQFFERLDQLNESADDRGQEILGALYDFAETIAPDAD